MNRRAFVRELTKAGCYLRRRGTDHDLYGNARTGRRAAVPRHAEIRESLCELIRKQLGLK